MSIRLETVLRPGWKQTENNRFGDILEVRFITTNDNKILFRYAPKFDDLPIWENIFKQLTEYDLLLKKLKTLSEQIEGTSKLINGACERC